MTTSNLIKRPKMVTTEESERGELFGGILLKNVCAKSPQWGFLAHRISSYSDKWFLSDCSWKLGMRKSVQFFLGHPVLHIETNSSKMSHYLQGLDVSQLYQSIAVLLHILVSSFQLMPARRLFMAIWPITIKTTFHSLLLVKGTKWWGEVI